MNDIYTKYLNASNFLDTSNYLSNRDYDKALENAGKINDESLRNTVLESLKNYSDISGHWAQDNISMAMEKGWVGKNNIFRPNKSITRAEFVTIINNAFGFTQKGDVTFKDVKSTDWFYGQVSVALKEGYIGGYEDNTFRPNEPITREEAAAIMTSIKQNKDDNIDKLIKYKDFNEVSEWAKSSVEGCIEAGYMGAGGEKFNPKSNITRAETIVTIERVLK
ncbi:S-layer homology domain-containing protein [Romboutsia lituseburensis]|nr:S-layer homology domain-containing protein [Romboutsia lituseburensis]